MDETQGALTEGVYYTLLALYRPLHGYGIMQTVRSLSGGRVTLGAGTLYGALFALVEKGWIRPCEGGAGGRRKEYEITQRGRAAVKAEIKRLEELLENGKKIDGGEIQ